MENMFDDPGEYITFGSVRNIPHWIYSNFAFPNPAKLLTMSFPLDRWPTGTIFCHSLSERRKAGFSLNKGLEHISQLDIHVHQEGQDGYGDYPTPEQVLAEVSICFKIS